MQALTPLSTLFADGEFDTGSLAAIGFLPLAVAIVVFWIGVKLQHAGKPRWIKWTAGLPLLVGLVIGIAPLRAYFFDKVYYDYLSDHGRKTMLLHLSGVLMPVLGALGLFGWQKWLDRQSFDEL